MKKVFLVIVSSLLVAFALTSFHRIGSAHADGSAAVLLDAGAGSGSAVTAAPVVPVDPTADPAGFLKQLSDLYHSGGWALLILFGVFGFCELLILATKNVSSLAWLAKGRASIVVGGLVAVTTAAIAALTHAGTWGAVIAAVIGAYTLYAHPAATDVAIAQVAKASLPTATLVKG